MYCFSDYSCMRDIDWNHGCFDRSVKNNLSRFGCGTRQRQIIRSMGMECGLLTVTQYIIFWCYHS